MNKVDYLKKIRIDNKKENLTSLLNKMRDDHMHYYSVIYDNAYLLQWREALLKWAEFYWNTIVEGSFIPIVMLLFIGVDVALAAAVLVASIGFGLIIAAAVVGRKIRKIDKELYLINLHLLEDYRRGQKMIKEIECSDDKPWLHDFLNYSINKEKP